MSWVELNKLVILTLIGYSVQAETWEWDTMLQSALSLQHIQWRVMYTVSEWLCWSYWREGCLLTSKKKEACVVVLISFFFLKLNVFTRVCIDSKRPKPEQLLVRWATPQLHDNDALANMVDPALRGLYPPKSLSRFADIIALCVQVHYYLLGIQVRYSYSYSYSYLSFHSFVVIGVCRRSLNSGHLCRRWWRHWYV